MNKKQVFRAWLVCCMALGLAFVSCDNGNDNGNSGDKGPSVTIKGTPKVGNTIIATSNGNGFEGDFKWYYASETEKNEYITEALHDGTSYASGLDKEVFTIPFSLQGQFIAATRRNYSKGLEVISSNYLGPIGVQVSDPNKPPTETFAPVAAISFGIPQQTWPQSTVDSSITLARNGLQTQAAAIRDQYVASTTADADFASSVQSIENKLVSNAGMSGENAVKALISMRKDELISKILEMFGTDKAGADLWQARLDAMLMTRRIKDGTAPEINQLLDVIVSLGGQRPYQQTGDFGAAIIGATLKNELGTSMPTGCGVQGPNLITQINDLENFDMYMEKMYAYFGENLKSGNRSAVQSRAEIQEANGIYR